MELLGLHREGVLRVELVLLQRVALVLEPPARRVVSGRRFFSLRPAVSELFSVTVCTWRLGVIRPLLNLFRVSSSSTSGRFERYLVCLVRFARCSR